MREKTKHFGLPKLGDTVVLGDTYYSLDGDKIVAHTIVTEYLVANRDQLETEIERLDAMMCRAEEAMDVLAELKDPSVDREPVDEKTDPSVTEKCAGPCTPDECFECEKSCCCRTLPPESER